MNVDRKYVIAILNGLDNICGYVREDEELLIFNSTVEASKEINNIYFELMDSEIELPDFCYVVQPLEDVINPKDGL